MNIEDFERLLTLVSDPSFLVQLGIFIFGVTGQFFVAKKKYVGFYFWLVGNALIITASLPQGEYGMVGLYIISTAFIFYSIKEWTKPETVETLLDKKRDIEKQIHRIQLNGS